jgi:dihydrodipicolinate synthase/N-acetylneuraminate lyase
MLHKVMQQTGVSGVKAAMVLMGRDCGAPRAPLPTIAGAELTSLSEKLYAIPAVGAEPKSWG